MRTFFTGFILFLSATSALAQTLPLSGDTLTLLTVLGKVPTQYQKLMSHGNQVTEVNLLAHGYHKKYEITVKNCNWEIQASGPEYLCTGGAKMEVSMIGAAVSASEPVPLS